MVEIIMCCACGEEIFEESPMVKVTDHGYMGQPEYVHKECVDFSD